jgi:hypothetical protein
MQLSNVHEMPPDGKVFVLGSSSRFCYTRTDEISRADRNWKGTVISASGVGMAVMGFRKRGVLGCFKSLPVTYIQDAAPSKKSEQGAGIRSLPRPFSGGSDSIAHHNRVNFIEFFDF